MLMLHDGSTTLSSNSKSSEDNHLNNNINNNIDKTTLLKNLLLSKFDKKIKNLENDSKNHLNLINITLNLTKNVTNTCIDLEKRIFEKINQKKKLIRNNTNRESFLTRNSKILKNNNNLQSNKTLPRLKTPLLHNSKSQIKFKTPKHIPKTLYKSKSNTNILKGRNENSRNSIRKSKTFKTLKPQKTVTSLRRKSVLVPNTNESKFITKNHNTSYYSESGKENKKDNSFISHQPSIFNKDNNLNNSKIQKERTKNQSSSNLDYVRINNQGKNLNEDLEIYLQKNLDLSEDQLITDIDFKINNNHLKIFSSKEFDLPKITISNNQINIYKYLDVCFENILKYLNKYEILNCLKVNKKFKNLINIFIIKKLKTDKEKYSNILFNIQKMENFDINKVIIHSNINLTLSKGTKKAILLLNEPVLNKLFSEEKLPDDDILLIYKIFFQLINHKITKNNCFYLNNKTNKINFWKECCNYFKNEKGGKTGMIIENVMKDQLNFSSENIYKILNLIDNKLFIVTPSYYTKKCSTTGLFVFFIKDILDYLGISHDKKTQIKGYNTYQNIINYIDKNIKKMREFI